MLMDYNNKGWKGAALELAESLGEAVASVFARAFVVYETSTAVVVESMRLVLLAVDIVSERMKTPEPPRKKKGAILGLALTKEVSGEDENPGALGPGQRGRLCGRAQLCFKPDLITLDAEICDSGTPALHFIRIEDIRIGMRSQFVSPEGIDARFMGPDNLKTLGLDVCGPGTDFTILVCNTSHAHAIRLTGQVHGDRID